jgi:hypothetical protein
MVLNSILFSISDKDSKTDSCFRRRVPLDWIPWGCLKACDGMIQVATAFHHFQRGNFAGPISRLKSAFCDLDARPEAFDGVAIATFRATLHPCLGAPRNAATLPLDAPSTTANRQHRTLFLATSMIG